MKVRLALLRIFAVSALLFFVWLAFYAATSGAWAYATLMLGFALVVDPFLMEPSYLLSTTWLVPQKLSQPVRAVTTIGVLLVALGFLLQISLSVFAQ